MCVFRLQILHRSCCIVHLHWSCTELLLWKAKLPALWQLQHFTNRENILDDYIARSILRRWCNFRGKLSNTSPSLCNQFSVRCFLTSWRHSLGSVGILKLTCTWSVFLGRVTATSSQLLPAPTVLYIHTHTHKLQCTHIVHTKTKLYTVHSDKEQCIRTDVHYIMFYCVM